MSKAYSIEEIQRALEFWEATKHCKSVWEGFQYMMKFAAGIHEVDNKAMERLRELVQVGKYVIVDSLGDSIRIICGNSLYLDDAGLLRYCGDEIYSSFEEKDVPSGILNIRLEK